MPKPYLLFLGDTVDPGFAKTAFGLRDWAGEDVVGEYALPGATVSAGLAPMTPADAAARGAKGMVIGVANAGGVIPESWMQALHDALCAGLDIVSGMHSRLGDLPGLAAAAARHGRTLFDVRVPPDGLPVASGATRSGRRVLTVGTDCALGKKYTALALAERLRARGIDAEFRATGQTGILIAGGGIPIDSVVADFVSGAAERVSPAASDQHVDIIEGQGSLFHPAYAPVSLGLLHGSQPDCFVVCHEPGRTHILGNSRYLLPSIEAVIEATIAMGRLTSPKIRCAGVSLNTSRLSEADAQRVLDETAARIGLPVADPMRGGAALDQLADSCLA